MTSLVVALILGVAAETGRQIPYDSIESPSGRVTVVFGEGGSGRATLLIEYFDASAPLPGLPDSVPTRARIVLAPDESAFQGWAGGRIPEWGAGVAKPAERLIVLPGFGSNRGAWDNPQTLRHEWAHLGLYEFMGGLRIPRWFSEGYAEWASGGWDWSEGWRLRILLARKGTSLDSLALSWPRGASEARSAYLLSATAVEYLVSEGGVRSVEIFLARWKELESFERAFRSTFGVTSGQFEQDWKKYVRKRYGWVFVLSHSAVFWMILALAVLLMARVRRRLNRLRMAGLRASEIPENPAFWVGSREPGGTGLDTSDSRDGSIPPTRGASGPLE
jgi:Peptidase MA superfamily